MMERRDFVLGLSFLLSLLGTFFLPKLPQDQLYHLFADTRSCLGVANFGDVVSNFGFLIVGALGLFHLKNLYKARKFQSLGEVSPFIIFFLSVAFVAPGSAYYHENPDNDRLFWDRLPMTVAFTSLFGAILIDRVTIFSARKLAGKLMTLLIFLGLASLVYWQQTESIGNGDLRPYILVQFYPLIALPLVCWMYPVARHTPAKYLVWMYVWYALAKTLEYFDAGGYDLLDNLISGHSLKHMAAAMAVYMVVLMLNDKRNKVLK
ncbi:hypothetical protein WH95_06115 [Kiloniella litopenaei]|uniref:Alkaline phytoceramidase n=1 Tax=Kiloniella litopenaei TaxID=1549748 RepID=A0A0M2RDA0_9PROT|nr:hypothetical protein [Kiloniella litopenaei]KKJ77980.1 hypothetical protein WH95_06115 [Kiloniella litopenaei]